MHELRMHGFVLLHDFRTGAPYQIRADLIASVEEAEGRKAFASFPAIGPRRMVRYLPRPREMINSGLGWGIGYEVIAVSESFDEIAAARERAAEELRQEPWMRGPSRGRP